MNAAPDYPVWLDLLEWAHERTPATGSAPTLEVRPGGMADYLGVDVKTVPLHGKVAAGRVAIVDDGDYEFVMQYRWHAWEKLRADGASDGPYARTNLWVDGREVGVFMHKLLTGWPMTDHANGNGLDNQRSNLRPATKAQNNHNQRPQRGTSSRFKGVTWHKGVGKWQASIKVNGKQRYLGIYASEEEAAAVYADAALQVQGEYAYAAREPEREDAA